MIFWRFIIIEFIYGYDRHMARRRILAPPDWRPAYLAAWRERAGLKREDIGPLIKGKGGKSANQLWKIEKGQAEYRQAILEAYAEACGCAPADILSGPPGAPKPVTVDNLLTLLQAIAERKTNDEIVRILRNFAG